MKQKNTYLYFSLLAFQQVIRDVQQYILCRLDQDYTLRQHIRRETAEMLNQLHIKSNGCFLYLEKVLDGISENFIVLREIREIPGTLYGLYLWLCQRLFTKKQFSKVQPILCILLASRKPMFEDEVFECLKARQTTLSKEDFAKRMHVLRRVLIVSPDNHQILFHHSFSEWFLDVKYCTQKYLCHVGEGHMTKALALGSQGSSLRASEIAELAYHLLNSTKFFNDPHLIPVFLLSMGVNLPNWTEFDLHAYDPKVQKLLATCGIQKASVAANDESKSEVNNISHRHGSETCLDEGGGEAPCENPEDPSLLQPVIDEASDHDANMKIEIISNMNEVDYNQRTPLHNAANDGNLPIVELLIAHGARLEATDRHGRTPLNLASRQVPHDSLHFICFRILK